VHGGPDPDELASLGLGSVTLVDFSVNVNPYGPTATVVAAARSADLARYPDPRATAVRRALADRWRREPAGVFFAHGASEILWDLARLLARRGAPALVVEPTFSEFGAALSSSRARWTSWRPTLHQGLAVDLDAVSEQLGRSRAAAVLLTSPTNPAGAPVPFTRIAELARSHPDVLVVVDESFLSLSDCHADAELPLPANAARLRSLTKEHAIPGLRAGYLLAEPCLVAELEEARPAWPTSAPAQAATLAAMNEEQFVAESRARLSADREELRRGLSALGLAPLPSAAPYLTFDTGDAAALRRRLLERGVLVRDCTSFGLPGMVRVAARPEPDRARLLAALREVL
jgi:histidinol-phosphate/aromatic aminotransferase/cobyric acid decarboxylase-like protein